MSVADMPDKTFEAEGKNITCYTITLDRNFTEDVRNALKNFMAEDSFIITKFRKGRARELNIRKQVDSITVSGNSELELVICQEQGKAAGKPAEILKAILDLTDEEIFAARILKVWSKPVVNNSA
jgi:hypothetical protein